MTNEERNAWVQSRYDELRSEGKHGHYETLFRVVKEALSEQEREHAKEHDGWQAMLIELREQLSQAQAALRTIQQWDCLNPPRADLLADLPWLRRVVDAALSGPEEGEPSHAMDRIECDHVWETGRSLTGSIFGPYEAVCRKCGHRPGPEEAKG